MKALQPSVDMQGSERQHEDTHTPPKLTHKALDDKPQNVRFCDLASAGKVEAASRKWQPEWVGSSVPGAIDHSKPWRLPVSGVLGFRVLPQAKP